MRYNSYPGTPLKISEIGLGAWQLGLNSGWKNLSESESIHLVKLSLDNGINFFDTAPNYGYGTGEQRLGKALKGIDRESVVINTKFGHTHDGKQNYESNYIRESLEGSLRRLNSDYVDSFIIHNPPLEYLNGNKNDHYLILERLKEEGKIKAYGASIDTYQEMKLLMDTTQSEVVEAFYNIFFQDIASAFDEAENRGMGIIVKIPLDSGWLSGKYDKETIFDGVRARWSKTDIDTRADLVQRVRDIIGPNVNMAQAAVAFCLCHNAVSTVIPGSLNEEQLKSNIESAELELSDSLVSQLREFYENEVKALSLPW